VDPNAQSVQSNLINPYCTPCHKGADAPMGLDLSDVTIYTDGQPHGAWRGQGLIVAGSSDSSLIVQIISTSDADSKMPPPDNTLGIPAVTADQLKGLSGWIDGLPH
jgi:hypothetical protein